MISMNRHMLERDSSPDFAGLGGDDPRALDWKVTPTDIIRFALISARRHRLLIAAIFLFGVGASIVYFKIRPPLYRVETTVLTQRAPALPSPIWSTVQDDPTHSVWELVHQRENLLTLIQQTKLYPSAASSHVDETRRPLLGRFVRLISDASADRDPLDALVKQLDRKLLVTTKEATIRISIDRPDPSQAYHLVETATQNFLDARHTQEITAIEDMVSMLKGRADALRDQLDRVTQEAQRRAPRQERDSHSELMAIPAAPQSGGEELVRLKAMVDAKERAIQGMEETRRRQLADLQAQLDQKRAAFTDAYPGVIQLRQDIEALSQDSPQIVKLREEHQKLQQEYLRQKAQQDSLARLARRRPAQPSTSPRVSHEAGSVAVEQKAGSVAVEQKAGSVAVEQKAGSVAMEQNEAPFDARLLYQQVVERLNIAQLELDAARVAFTYRYNVIWPAEVPTDPVSPKAWKIFGLGIPGAPFLAMLAAVLIELRRGTVLDRWQVERGLGLPVLAELKRNERQ